VAEHPRTTPPTLRLHLFFAAENDRAVILRQGPSRLFRMILWHRDTDRFEDGQWLKHKVYVERCDLSPDGRHFLFFALDGKWGGAAGGSYTAISRPPFFTARVLHPQGDTWGGGGAFLSNDTYAVDGCGADDILRRRTGLRRAPRPAPSPLSLQIPPMSIPQSGGGRSNTRASWPNTSPPAASPAPTGASAPSTRSSAIAATRCAAAL
jgi:hypothetical protein